MMDKIVAEEILTEDEIKASKDAFDAYDKIGYGTLEIEELQKVLEGQIFNYKIKKQSLDKNLQRKTLLE